MIVSTQGKPRASTLKECKAAAEFAASQLMSNKLANNITVKLLFSKEQTADKGWDGFADWVDRNDRPREFIIGLDPNLSRKALLSTLFHEMVHIKQYATGQLKDYKRMKGTINWMGRLLRDNKSQAKHTPWEREARRKEVTLYKDFQNNSV